MIFAAIADWVDTDSYPVTFMCDQLGVSTSGYYRWRGHEPSAHEREVTLLTDRIGRSFTAEHVNERWCGDITYIKRGTGGRTSSP